MTGDLKAPNLTATTNVQGSIVKATDHMEGVGKYQSASFTGGEQEFTIPSWANSAQIIVQQGFANAADGSAFECLIKAGTGTNYGTLTSTNSIVSWTGGGVSVTNSDATNAVPYLRLFTPFALIGPGQYFTVRATGVLYLSNIGGGLYNVLANWYGASFQNSDSTLGPATFWANGAGNMTTKPGVISFRSTVTALDCSVAVIFNA